MSAMGHDDARGPVPEGVVTMVDRVRDILTAERVVGAPIERDGVTVIPVVSVRGGGGGGSGTSGGREEATVDRGGSGGDGAGLGFGVMARPIGSYVIENGAVRWVPAIDASRIAFVALAGWFILFRWLRAADRRRKREARR